MSIYDSAIAFAARGWPVLPLHSIDQSDGCCTCGKPDCTSPGKHPLTPNGVKDATVDAIKIKRWCDETFGLANIGIASGNGLVIVDVDAKSGGLATIDKWQSQFGALPLTPTVCTGGGGFHYYFSMPKGRSVANKVAVAAGIDIRCDGGYVVAPPSLHKSGEQYKWMAPEGISLAEVPVWLLDMIDADDAAPQAAPALLKVEGFDLTNAPGARLGERNASLCRLAGTHLARGDSVHDIEPLALAWADRCVPVYPLNEVLKTLQTLSIKARTHTNKCVSRFRSI